MEMGRQATRRLRCGGVGTHLRSRPRNVPSERRDRLRQRRRQRRRQQRKGAAGSQTRAKAEIGAPPLWPLFCRRHCRAPVPLATLESSCSPDDSAFAVVSGRRGNGEVMDALFDSDSDGEAYDFEEDDI